MIGDHQKIEESSDSKDKSFDPKEKSVSEDENTYQVLE